MPDATSTTCTAPERSPVTYRVLPSGASAAARGMTAGVNTPDVGSAAGAAGASRISRTSARVAVSMTDTESASGLTT